MVRQLSTCLWLLHKEPSSGTRIQQNVTEKVIAYWVEVNSIIAICTTDVNFIKDLLTKVQQKNIPADCLAFPTRHKRTSYSYNCFKHLVHTPRLFIQNSAHSSLEWSGGHSHGLVDRTVSNEREKPIESLIIWNLPPLNLSLNKLCYNKKSFKLPAMMQRSEGQLKVSIRHTRKILRISWATVICFWLMFDGSLRSSSTPSNSEYKAIGATQLTSIPAERQKNSVKKISSTS